MFLYLRVVPGFWIAVEECRRPELYSRPVVIGGLPHQRGVVREANFQAQRHGIRVGMSLSQAHQQCPDTLFLVPDLLWYQTVWESICTILQMYTPLVEPVEAGQAVCDLSGTERQWNGIRGAARIIAQHVHQATGITPWLGIATNRIVAELASLSIGGEGMTIIDAGQEQQFLANLPLTLLPDTDPRLALTFQVLGFRTIGQFAALPALAVRQRFGSDGERLHRYARGIDTRPVRTPPSKPSVNAHYECEDGSIEEVISALQYLAETCATELQQRALAGRIVTLQLTWTAASQTSLPVPIREVRVATRTLHLDSSLNADRYLSSPDDPHLSSPSPLESGERLEVPGTEKPAFPIPYRIHSMLPQPNRVSVNGASELPISASRAGPVNGQGNGARSFQKPTLPMHDKISVAVRTPIQTAASLLEQAQHLLLQRWSRDSSAEAASRHLQAVDLQITEFEDPVQLSFAEFNRLDETGMLSGMSAERLHLLAQQEHVLAARYGHDVFCHVAHLDPGNILTERRFQWGEGLPRRATPKGKPRKGTRRRKA